MSHQPTPEGVTMTTRRATDEADIRRRLEEWAEALRAMDLDAVASSYAPDIVSFDVGPALRQVGAAAKRMNWEQLFAMFQHPLSYEIRDLTIHVSDDLAFGYSLNRVSGTLKDGTTRELPWVRF